MPTEHDAVNLGFLRATMVDAITSIAEKINALPDAEFERVRHALRQDIALLQARLWPDRTGS
jgi:uncharacterized protein HemX